MSNRIVGRIKAEIRELAERHGGILTPATLVAYARDNPLSALHGCFDWDVNEAAEKWWLAQAHKLLRQFKIKVEGDDGATITIRGFVSLPSDRGPEGLYRSTLTVLGEEDQLAEMVETAKSELAAFRVKYAVLQKVAAMRPIFEAIDEALGD